MTVYRYIVSEVLKYAGIVLSAVAGIYVAVDFFERIDNFLEAGLPASRTLVYIGYKLPMIIAQMLPVSLLLSILITFGIMSRNNEIVALKSGGISVYALLKPVLSVGLLFAGGLFILTELIVPLTAGEANRIWLSEVKKRDLTVSREKNIWLKDKRQISYMKFYNKMEKTVWGVTLYFFDDAFQLDRRVDARWGVFSKNGWVLFDIMEQRRNPDTGEYQIDFHEEKQETRLNITPDSLETAVKKSEEMSFPELYRYIRKVEAEGYDATPYRVDFHAKAAFTFICIILSAAGMGIASGSRLKDGLPVSIALGIGVAFLYWIFYSFCISLGYGGMLPPVVAAWTANFLFACFSAVLLVNAE